MGHDLTLSMPAFFSRANALSWDADRIVQFAQIEPCRKIQIQVIEFIRDKAAPHLQILPLAQEMENEQWLSRAVSVTTEPAR